MRRVVGWRGVGVALEGPADLLDGLAGQLPPFYGGTGEVVAEGVVEERQGLLHVDLPDDLSVAGTDRDELLRAGASRVELLVVERLPDRVAVHAGVVAVDGAAILVPGRSMAGKSTLVRAFLDAGATYLSDEFALLDDRGRVHPYPRRMTMRTASGSHRAIPDRAAGVDDAPLPVALMAHVRFAEEGWATTRVSPGTAVLALVDNCVCIRREPARSLTALVALAEAAVSLQGTRGEAAEAVVTLTGLLA